jgi:HEAT repeat protein
MHSFSRRRAALQHFSLRRAETYRLMISHMNKSVWRLALVIGTAVILAGCGNKETTEALFKATALNKEQQYHDANNVLVDALQTREAKIRADAGTPADSAAADALRLKVQSDPEILKMERAQIPLYLHLERPDMASAVYADILSGNPGDSVVYDTLHDSDPVIRAGAVRILGLVGKPDAIDALAGAAKDSDQDVRRAAVAALGSIKDPKAVPILIASLKDSYWFARSEAATALGQENDGRATKPLLDAVTDPDNTVQTAAESSLVFLSKQSPSPLSADDLASRLNDPSPKIVLVSAICLALLKDTRSIPILEKLVDDTDPIARLDAVKGLGETGDPSVIPILRKTLKSSDINMQGWSIIGLGNLKDQGSMADLQAIASDNAEPDTIRAAATAAVNKITGKNPSVSEP